MNKQNIILMLENAAAAYSNTQALLPDIRLIKIDGLQTDIQCYVRIKNDTIFLSFRGTDSIKDIITDIKFWKQVIPYNNTKSKIRVHSGFINTYKSPEIREKIHSLINDNIHYVKITGHSYGAALAVLCAVDLEYNFPDKDYEVVLFGCPRVGNKAFKRSYDKRIYKTLRIENGNDLVTKIPFAFLNYHHVGIKIHIGFPRLFGKISLKDHKTQSYYQRLWHSQY